MQIPSLSPEPELDVKRMAAEIVAAYVSSNSVPVARVSELIRMVIGTLMELTEDKAPPEEEQKPQVPIKRSVTPDYIVCLEDGKKLKMLKRHLRTAFNLSPDEYRKKWGLPRDYPMVAPNYAARRAEVAKQTGLGRGPAEPQGSRRVES